MQEIWHGPVEEPDMEALLTGSLQEIKRRAIQKVLQLEGGNKTRTAKRLGVDRATIDRLTE